MPDISTIDVKILSSMGAALSLHVIGLLSWEATLPSSVVVFSIEGVVVPSQDTIVLSD
jgi:hypothetical protein